MLAVFEPAMVLFALLMLIVAVHPQIHTGWLGSIGCVLMGVAAFLAVDNASLAYVEGTKRLLLLLCGGVGMVVVNIFWMLYRASVPVEKFKHPLRRRTDFNEFDEAPRAAALQPAKGSR